MGLSKPATCGWVLTDGAWHTCDEEWGHDALAERLGLPVQKAERRWVRVTKQGLYGPEPNNAQAATLARLLDEGVISEYQAKNQFWF